MSIPITTDTDLFSKEGFCPGAGVLAVHVPDAYDFSSHSLEEAVKRGIPPCTSFGRPPMQFTRRVQALLYSSIRAAVNSLFDAWGEHVSRREKAPVVNHTYMEKWFDRMHLNREEVMAQMGVAQPGDTIDLGLTPKGGRKVVITTFENAYGEAFARRRQEVYHGNLPKPVLLEMLIDITILTALAEFNRRMMYEQLCRQLDWTEIRTVKHIMTTLTSGICLPKWELFSGEVRIGDYDCCLLPYGKDSWLVCSVGEGEENPPVPWKVIHDIEDCPIQVGNRIETKVSVTCMPIEHTWCTEYN